MPCYDFQCLSCQHVFESIIRKPEEMTELRCPDCQGADLQRLLSFPGNYTIKGDNSASVRPKGGMGGGRK